MPWLLALFHSAEAETLARTYTLDYSARRDRQEVRGLQSRGAPPCELRMQIVFLPMVGLLIWAWAEYVWGQDRRALPLPKRKLTLTSLLLSSLAWALWLENTLYVRPIPKWQLTSAWTRALEVGFGVCMLSFGMSLFVRGRLRIASAILSGATGYLLFLDSRRF